METRRCIFCGTLMVEGMTDLESFYSHERCFTKAMNQRFPNGWRETEKEGRYGGYYERYCPIDKTWKDTGIFYTEWY